MTFYTNLLLVQIHCVLFSIKYLVLKTLVLFSTGLDILFISIKSDITYDFSHNYGKSNLIQMMYCLYKKYFLCVMLKYSLT